MTQREVLDIATCMGYYILKNGGEISRAEDTAERIGLAYGMDAVHVFAVASSIVVSVEVGDESLSQTRRVKSVTTNLERLKEFNSLSREICEKKLSVEEVIQRIREIKNKKTYNKAIMLLAYGIIGGAFSVFFGGGIKECICGFLIGAVLWCVISFADKINAVPFFKNFAGAAATVFMTYVLSFAFKGIDEEIVNIGVLMNLVPGVLLTNCIRDFVSTDYMAGTAKIFETLLIAAAIALGVSVSLIWR